MTIKNITLVVGTRPQILKSYPLIKSLNNHGFKVDLVNTGQHYDHALSGVFLCNLDTICTVNNLKIKPATPNTQLSDIIAKLEPIFQKNNPDLVIAPGDTTSALATGITAVKCNIKLAHLEAGGRSIHTKMQEEVNRRLLDHSSDILFAPTKNCATNLENENVPGTIYFVGDTMYDLFLEEYMKHHLDSIQKSNHQILLTLHRSEHISQKMSLLQTNNFLYPLSHIGYDVIFPIHPHTRKKLDEFGIKFNAKLIEPMDHVQMMKLMAKSTFVVTDSGGLQKEAYWMGKPCLAIHPTFEWKELVNERVNFPVWPDKTLYLKTLNRMHQTKFTPKPIFGTGDASDKISQILKQL